MPDGGSEEISSHPVTVRDTTGAGDTFNGVLAARLAGGAGLGLAVRTATVAASLSVAHVGAREGMPALAAIDAAMQTA
jgi:ribokinase